MNKRDEPLKVGIVGCGGIAEHHLKFLVAMQNVEVAGLVDINIANAKARGEIFGLKKIYSSLEELLDSTTIDILHILTPPQYHFEYAKRAIEREIHVLIEKPFALSLKETKQILSMAEQKNVKVCADFIHLFNPIVLEAKEAVKKYDMGDLIRAECYMGVDLDIPEHKEALGLHWHYSLPGGLMHDFIPHPLYKVIAWIGHPKTINVWPRCFGSLPQGLTDHIDVLLEGEKAAGFITLTFAPTQPNDNLKLIFNRGIIIIDFITQTTVIEPLMNMPGAAVRVVLNFSRARQLVGKTVRNVFQFLRGEMVPYHGLKYLIEEFYGSISGMNDPPISRELILSVALAEEEIIKKLGKVHLNTTPRPSNQNNITRKEKILLTGATGYLGKEVADQWVEAGYYVRALVRKTSFTDALQALGVELFYGDIRESEAVTKATQGMDIVINCAASLSGSPDLIMKSAVKGTRNIATAAKDARVKQVIYISSFSVFEYYGIKDGTIIDENSLQETRPELRGVASTGKCASEKIALSNLPDDGPAWTVLRPTIIFGNNLDLTSLLGVRVGRLLICFGSSRKHIPLIHIRDLTKAILSCIDNARVKNKVFNISHDEQIKAKEIVREVFKRSTLRKLRPVYIRYTMGLLMILGFKVMKITLGKGPDFNKVRLAYLCRDILPKSEAFRLATGWKPESTLLTQLQQEAARVK
jgi:predicted dehydrogenase/nucleoside-diphosphate-sugar epimerase